MVLLGSQRQRESGQARAGPAGGVGRDYLFIHHTEVSTCTVLALLNVFIVTIVVANLHEWSCECGQSTQDLREEFRG